MLVLSRKKNESIIINDDITIVVVEIRGDKVRLGVEAPKEVPVHRNEVYEAIRRNQQKPDSSAQPVVERDGNLIMVDDERLPLRPGEKPVMKMVRFRTLGCYPLSGAVESQSTTLTEIIQEMLLAKTSERQGRVIDHDEAGSMEEKKRQGYF